MLYTVTVGCNSFLTAALAVRPGCSRALLEVRRFPALERSFTEWSGLGGVPIGRTDIVVLGHVRDYYSRLRALDTACRRP